MMALSVCSINLAYYVTMYANSYGNNDYKIKILRIKLYKFPLYYKKDLFEGLIKLFFFFFFTFLLLSLEARNNFTGYALVFGHETKNGTFQRGYFRRAKVCMTFVRCCRNCYCMCSARLLGLFVPGRLRCKKDSDANRIFYS